MAITFVLLALVLALLTAEAVTLRRARAAVPLRILVNGTRGKSSVTRLIAAGLRVSSHRTLAKITGVIPTIILPDGSDEVIGRRGPARIPEQWRLLRRGARIQADALALECMSVTPELQRLETRILRPQIYVLTNIRDDHQEHMGTLAEQIETFCSTIPNGCTVITGETKHLDALRKAVAGRQSTLIVARSEHRTKRREIPAAVENQSLAAAVLACLGADSPRALKALQKLSSGIDNASFTFKVSGGMCRFINGFDVNDVESAERVLIQWEDRLGLSGDRYVVLNTRMDRPLRTLQFADWLASLPRLRDIVLTGSHVFSARRRLVRKGFIPTQIHRWSRDNLADARRSLERTVPAGSVVFGFGNIAGDGLSLLANLRQSNAAVA